MAEENGQERTEQATPKRLREAREKGQIARSRELTTFAMLLTSGAAIYLLGENIVDGLTTMMKSDLHMARDEIYDATKLPGLFLNEVINILWVLSPFLLLLTVVAVLAPMALGGWSFSAEAILFKWDRIDPIKGIKRIFSWKSVVEIIKALAKFGLIAAVSCFVIWKMRDQIAVIGDEDVLVALNKSGSLLVLAFIATALPLLVVVAIDVPFQIWDFSKQMRMSRQEVKDENKETEGNPEIKGRIRNIQIEMARRRMMAEVPRADVIITNPTHYAVALKYDQAKMLAPVVIAKGADLVAMQIRSVGGASHVTIVSAPALARSIYYSTELNKEIPAGLYLAVAQILAYVYQLRAKGKARHKQDVNFDDVPIPAELRRDN